jgi:DNA topoisomerase VI subunit A
MACALTKLSFRDVAAQEVTRHQAYLESKQQERELLEATKAERLHKAFIHSQFIKEALEETDSPAWRLALETKHAREQRRATFYRQLMAKHHKAQVLPNYCERC